MLDYDSMQRKVTDGRVSAYSFVFCKTSIIYLEKISMGFTFHFVLLKNIKRTSLCAN